ncbi:hypothetical protein NUM3379_02920 [Kineococcus sp. NUM-3379]
MLRGLFDNPVHLLILLVLVLLLFGAKRLPDAARGLGRSLRIFKSEVKEMKKDDDPGVRAETGTPLEGRVVDADTRRESTGTPTATGTQASAPGSHQPPHA